MYSPACDSPPQATWSIQSPLRNSHRDFVRDWRAEEKNEVCIWQCALVSVTVSCITSKSGGSYRSSDQRLRVKRCQHHNVSFVRRCKLNYGLGLTSVAQTKLLKLDRVQNEAMRVVVGTTKDTPTETMRFTLDLPPMQTRQKVKHTSVPWKIPTSHSMKP